MNFFYYSILIGCGINAKTDNVETNVEPSEESNSPTQDPTQEPSSPTQEPSSPTQEPSSPVADQDQDGFLTEGGDCDDTDANIYPGAPEIIGDGIDQDCSGADWFADITVQGIRFKYLPPTLFTMGSPETEIGHFFDETERIVSLTQGFYLMETEVTQSMYETLRSENPASFSSCGADCPIENVSWNQAAMLANALSNLESLENCYTCTDSDTDGLSCVESKSPYQCLGYRLPTEAEWEYAAKGHQTGPFYSSEEGSQLSSADQGSNCDSPSQLSDGSVLGDLAWYCENSDLTPHPVQEKIPNHFGFYDILGNVYEWVHDDYSIPSSGSVTDPVVSGTSDKILKGGDWNNIPENLRPAFRTYADPNTNYSRFGIRLSKTYQ